MISALFCSVNPRGLLLLLLSLLIHDRLHGWAGSFCPEQNHTAKPNFMLSIYHFDDSGRDRTHFITSVKTPIKPSGPGVLLVGKSANESSNPPLKFFLVGQG